MLWPLNPSITFLNHGSFGVCPRPVLEKQNQYRELFENEPIDFVIRKLDGMIYHVRESLAKFVHCNIDDLVLIPNVTHGVNSVLKSYPFVEGDEVLITNHIYNACRIALNYVKQQKKLAINEVELDLVGIAPEMVIEKVLSSITKRTRLVMIDHITSPTALIFPVEEIVKELNKRGIDSLIDGAHAPGAIPLNINNIDACFYTGNCHKWMCAPKGVGFLQVRKDKQSVIQPLVHSHFSGPDRSFADRFHWSGTTDPSAALCIPDIIELFNSQFQGGWEEWMVTNHTTIVNARKLICNKLNIQLPCPDDMLSTMAAIPIGQSQGIILSGYNEINKLQEYLFAEHRIEVPVFTWPDDKRLIIRPSAQIYNSISQYENLAEILSNKLNDVSVL